MKRLEYAIGDRVSLVTDLAKAKRIVTGINLRLGGVIYILACGTDGETAHYATEMELFTNERHEAGFKK